MREPGVTAAPPGVRATENNGLRTFKAEKPEDGGIGYQDRAGARNNAFESIGCEGGNTFTGHGSCGLKLDAAVVLPRFVPAHLRATARLV